MANGAAAFTGISQGVRKGLKAHRQRERQKEQDERAEESHNLGMRQTRQQIEQSEELFPEKKRQQELATEASEIEVNEAEAKKGAPVALQALESGDLDAVTGYMQNAFPGEMGNAALEQDDDGNIYALRETSDGKVQRREMDQEELGAIIRQAGGMETQDSYSAPVEIPGVGIGQRNENTGEYDVLREFDSDSGSGGGGAGGWDPTEMRQQFKTMRESVYTYFAPNDTFSSPEAKDQAKEAVRKGGDLIMAGVPQGDAQSIAIGVAKGPLSEEEARMKAKREASQKDIGGLFDGGEEDEWVEQRTQELIEESKKPIQRYNSIVGQFRSQQGGGLVLNRGQNRGGQESASSGDQGGGSGGPRSARPDQSSGEQDAGHSPEIEMVDTENHGRLPKPPTDEAAKENLPPGQKFVHPENGKVYQMPQE